METYGLINGDPTYYWADKAILIFSGSDIEKIKTLYLYYPYEVASFATFSVGDEFCQMTSRE